MKKKLFRITIALVGILVCVTVALQFTKVVDNPPVTENIPAPDDVKAILQKSCYDCHSNQTRITWLQKLPIASSIVASDVKGARSVLNFSEWNKYSPQEQKVLVSMAVSKATSGQMPPEDYLIIHPKAKLNEQEKAILENWVTTFTSTQTEISPDQQAMYEKAYTAWQPIRGASFKVQNAPGGFVFPADYRNWRSIAVSTRNDNGTIRLILGNDIAIEAARHKQTNPWPDGTILGKIVWQQRQDPDWKGAIVPGTFVHAEFMFKDSKKYASTYGWGWARWLGMDLVPYGLKEGESDKTCISCHTPVKNNDWVFTHPAIMP